MNTLLGQLWDAFFSLSQRVRVRKQLRDVWPTVVLLTRGLYMGLAPAPAVATIYVALAVLTSAMPVAQVWLGKILLDQLALVVGGAAIALSVILLTAALYALTMGLQTALEPVQEVLTAWLEDRAVGAFDRRLMAAGGRLIDLYQVERPSFQDNLAVVQFGSYIVPRLPTFLQSGLRPALTLAGLLFLLARLHPFIPLVLMLATVPYLISERRMAKNRQTVIAKQSRAAREMEYYTQVTTEPQPAKEVRVFGLGDFFLQRFEERRIQALRELDRVRLIHLRSNGFFGALYALALGGGFWYVAAQAGAGHLTVGDIALYLGAITQSETALKYIGQWVGRLYEMTLRLDTIFSFLDRSRPHIALAPAADALDAPHLLQEGIAFQDVTFQYPEGESDVLHKVCATLPAGKVTALVGVNGAGKSTLVKLLTRMYDPTAGEILLNGKPLHAYDLESLRRRIAVVYQDFAQFALSLGENISVGAGGLDTSDERMRQAAAWAGADQVAANLAQGYDTQLTRRFSGGVELSGGEWQKVALARGFMRDAAFVILDEPTAALDAEAEYHLFQRFRELVAGKTALIISHRFSTVRMADNILVLEDGAIIENGSHQDLMAANGRYATLYAMQASWYQ
ncbi:MAG: ABC transporter ATP-binding protein [Chloroflexi bacterium]|nr:ABC transporter ATP-binding protein [Chloroflexota bacterium]